MNRSHSRRNEDTAVTLAALVELIDALDRRIPLMARTGEVHICKQAADLKSEALGRIQVLNEAVRTREAALSQAVMTDDGGPPPALIG
jgi:hypothetical protein